MKRLHVHVGVDSLDRSIRFYSELFGTQPSVVKSDYAKWMLDDPKVNFAISEGHATRGIEHLGIQVDSTDELAEVHGRLIAAGGPIIEERATTCCYAKSDKNWITDPQGVMWETFYTDGEATSYGAGAPTAAPDTCCTPRIEA